jgi:hypothetical protein
MPSLALRMWVVCYYTDYSILLKRFEKGTLEEAGRWPGICQSYDPPSKDDHMFRHPGEDTR